MDEWKVLIGGRYYWAGHRSQRAGEDHKDYVHILGERSKITREEADKQLEKWIDFYSLPRGNYDVIYADPPWKYDFSKSDSRSIEAHYPTMTLEEICNLKIPSAKDSVLFLWATMPKIRESLKVAESWGFEYKTGMVWVKEKMGMGYYARGRHELLLIATKGDTSPPGTVRRGDSVIHAGRTEHSKKPEIVYEIIESMYPGHDYLELFARSKRDGWTVWGLEV